MAGCLARAGGGLLLVCECGAVIHRPLIHVGGPPGAGKTTFIEALLAANDEEAFIVVRARRVASLVSEGDGAEVETAIVDGRVLMENRRLSTIDGARVLAEAQRIAERIARQLPNHEPLRPRWPVL